MTTLLADAAAADPYHHGLSLLRGWLPIVIQLVTAAILLAAVGWRTRRWRLLWLPLAVMIGVAAAAWANWFIDSQGMADDPAPDELWVWIGLSGLAIGVAVFGFASAAWWRRGVSVLAVAACLLSTALAVNFWVGYFPTVQTAWNQLTAGPLPDETDLATVQAQKASHTVPAHGAVVPVTIPADASGFAHREELVYLPPAWFAGDATLPTVMMVGGEFNTPADWLRTGDAAAAMDGFAAAHGGNAPVFVFIDSGGSFNNDTECVNGPRGDVADHLTKDVVPYMNSTFGVSPAAANWGIVGWSMGGTCAVDLTVMHPELFSAFVDIAGDLGPTAGTKEQTVARLFGGSEAAWAQFDPSTVMNARPSYQGVSGWFQISSDAPTQHKGNQAAASDAVGLGGRDAGGNPGDQTAAAQTLCHLGAAKGMDCAVISAPGKHDWPFAKAAFTASLPWLAGKLGTPGVPPVGFPAAAAAAPISVAEPATGR